jgi:hypothetical protein
MSFTIYRSTDASAPVLTGTANSLRALLKACLVDGYGSQSAAGWSEAFTGTNKAVFRPGSGARHYLRVQDDAAGTGGAKEALIRGFETMSDVDNGTGPFPTAAQSTLTSNSLVARKSVTADSTARPWIVAADAATFYAFVSTGDNTGTYRAFGFGDFYSLVPNDPGRSILIGRNYENNGSSSYEAFGTVSYPNTATIGHYAAKNRGGSSSWPVGKHTDFAANSGTATAQGVLAYANPDNGCMFISPFWVHDPSTGGVYTRRGRLRGLWAPMHSPTNFTDGDTLPGGDLLASKAFLVETSDTVETN